VNPEKERIFYGADPSQFGDLRLPGGPGPHPVVIVIHGGFWYDRYGLNLMDEMSEDLTNRGLATWNIEYRRVGQMGGGWPGTLQDVANAIDHLRIIAQQFPLDLSKVLVIGHSAGGHLALWAAARHRFSFEASTDSPQHPLPIHGAVSLAGVSDLRLMWEVRQTDSPVVDFLAGTPTQVPERYALASPIEHLPTGIPQILIHGTQDDRVPLQISQRYAEQANNVGDPVTLVVLPDVEHFKVIQPGSEAWPAVVKALTELLAKV
jgi:acetyl esterase/lipase